MQKSSERFWFKYLLIGALFFGAFVFHAGIVHAESPSEAQLRQYDIRVDGMVCPFCVATSRRELEKIVGVHQVTADLERGVIMVCVDEQVTFTEQQLKKLFARKGFTYRSFTQRDGCSQQ